jgi:isopenicillin N synthase-like dioxygenase
MMNVLSHSIRPRPCRLAAASIRTFAAHVNTNPIPDLGNTMPSGHNARVGSLQTFTLPQNITGSQGERIMGRAMVDIWRQDGILQIATNPFGQKIQAAAMEASRRFFRKPYNEKAACVDPQSYSGYISSGEEITDGIADYSEIFTVTKDLPLYDARVRAKWPCHGPCPWPDREMKGPIETYMKWLDTEGGKLLRLIEFGLDVPEGSLTKYTQDGWHHARVLRLVNVRLHP